MVSVIAISCVWGGELVYGTYTEKRYFVPGILIVEGDIRVFVVWVSQISIVQKADR